MRREKRRGFSLLEAMFSLFLTFLVLGSLVYTLKQAGAVKRNTKNMDRLSEVVHGLILVKSDIRAALGVTVSGGVLELDRVDPDRTFRQRIGPSESSLPHDTPDQMQVRYFLNDGILRRQVTGSVLGDRIERLLEASDFSVSRSSNPDVITVRLEVENERVKKVHTMKVAET